MRLLLQFERNERVCFSCVVENVNESFSLGLHVEIGASLEWNDESYGREVF
jgi:hypothetical protein